MARKRAARVVVDPIAAAEQLGGMFVDPAQVPTDLMEPAMEAGQSPAGRQCALGHANTEAARFCATCGLTMDAQAPVTVDLEAARPKPASELSAAERAERDRQHAEALAAARQFENAPAVFVPSEGEAVLVHFIEDGLTAFGQVWYRGQEIEIGPGHPRWEEARAWVLLDRTGQISRWGKQFFAPGPWPGRQSYLDGADGFEKLGAEKGGGGTFAGPGEEALRKADEMERRRGRAVPARSALLR